MNKRLLVLLLVLYGCETTGEGDAPAGTDTTAAGAADTVGSATAASPSTALPGFEEYAVNESFDGSPAAVDLSSAEYGSQFETRLRDAAAEGPDFAGHYTVAEWGCGTSCQIVAVIDARTGELSEQTLMTQNGVEYRRDSALLIADPVRTGDPPECASCGTTAAYVWRDGRFEPVGEGEHPHLEQRL